MVWGRSWEAYTGHVQVWGARCSSGTQVHVIPGRPSISACLSLTKCAQWDCWKGDVGVSNQMEAEGRKAWCNACEGRPREDDWGCVQTLGGWQKEGLVTCDHRENQRKKSTMQHVQNEPEERRGQNGAYYRRMRNEKSAVMFKKMEGEYLLEQLRIFLSCFATDIA